MAMEKAFDSQTAERAGARRGNQAVIFKVTPAAQLTPIRL